MSWNCKNDKPDDIEIPAPPENRRVTSANKDFAEGKFEAILSKGGPTDAYLWAHLHGVHNDRQGETHYSVGVKVVDEDNYVYMFSPPLLTTVTGVWDKSERHRHCFLQYSLPPGQEADWLKIAIEKKKLVIEIAGDRDRNDLDWFKDLIGEQFDEIKDLIQDFANGKVDIIQLLQKVNNGRAPSL